MATSLKMTVRNGWGIALASVLCATFAVSAETLTDPTRPAIELVPNIAPEGGSAVVGSNAAGASTPKASAGLQSVMISPKRTAAIINGVEVKIGDKVGDATLTVVNETCVVLMGAEGRQVMHLYPSVKMSKNEQACLKRSAMLPIDRTTVAKGGRPAPSKHTAKPSTHAANCVPEANKEGSIK